MASVMVWALSSKELTATHITEVRSGLDCDCVCPGCKAILEAVNSENPLWKRRPHFRHHKSDELRGCGDASLLAAARSCVAELSEILLPARIHDVRGRLPGGRPVADTVSREAEVAKIVAYEFVDVADAVLTLENGRQIFVRLIASGRPNEAGKQEPLAEVVIDLSDPVLSTADRATLRQHISLSPAHRTWCRNQEWQSHQDAAQRQFDEKIHAQSVAAPPAPAPQWQFAPEVTRPSVDEAAHADRRLPPVEKESTFAGYRYSWSSSWWRSSEKLLADLRHACESASHADLLYKAVVGMMRQPAISPLDFAIALEGKGVPRDIALAALHALVLAVRVKCQPS